MRGCKVAFPASGRLHRTHAFLGGQLALFFQLISDAVVTPGASFVSSANESVRCDSSLFWRFPGENRADWHVRHCF